MPECLNETLHSPELEAIAAVIDREPLRLLVIGSKAGVIETIHTLHHRGFAEVGSWSPLLPAPNLGEVMSIHTRYRHRNG